MGITSDARLPTVLTARAIVQDEHADTRIVRVARIRARDRSPFLVIAQLPLRPQALVALILALRELVIPVRSVAHAQYPCVFAFFFGHNCAALSAPGVARMCRSIASLTGSPAI